MGKRCCFVPGCKTGYLSDRKKTKEEGRKVKSLFSAPKDPDLLMKWKIAVRRKDKDLDKNCSVCEIHFLKEDIIKLYETKMPDGSIHTLERGTPKLKEGAVPCLFPNLPGYLSNCATKRRLPKNKSYMSSVRHPLPDNALFEKSKAVVPVSRKELISSDCICEDDIVMSSTHIFPDETSLELEQEIPLLKKEAIPNFRVKKLKTAKERRKAKEDLTITRNNLFNITVGEIEVPNQWWSVSCTPEFILCSKWDASYICEKKVIIGEGLNVKLFLKDHEITEKEDLKLPNLAELSSLLCKVDRYCICPGIDEFKEKCLKYQKNIENRRQSLWCINCRRERRLVQKRLQYVKVRLASEEGKEAKRKADKRRLRCVLRQNNRLRKKVDRLQRRVKILMHKSVTFDYDCEIKDIQFTSDIDDDIENDMDINDIENDTDMASDIDDVEDSLHVTSNTDKVGNATPCIDTVGNTTPCIDTVGNTTRVALDSKKKVDNIIQNQTVIAEIITSDIDKVKNGIHVTSGTDKVKRAVHVARDSKKVENAFQNQTVIAEIYLS